MVGQALTAPDDSGRAYLDEEESEEEEPRSSVYRTRELFWGPKSWVFAFCLLGPLVAFCPCDGRHVWKSDLDVSEEVSADDDFDQRGAILLRPVSSSRLSDQAGASEPAEPRGTLPTRQDSLGAVVHAGPALLFPSARPLPAATSEEELGRAALRRLPNLGQMVRTLS